MCQKQKTVGEKLQVTVTAETQSNGLRLSNELFNTIISLGLLGSADTQ